MDVRIEHSIGVRETEPVDGYRTYQPDGTEQVTVTISLNGPGE